MHPVKRISFVTPDPDDEKIFGYVCSQPDWLPLDINFMLWIKSGNVRGTKEIICFINWIFTGNAEAKWSCFETCLVHCVVLLMGSDVLITLTKCVCWGTYFRINFDVKLLHSEKLIWPSRGRMHVVPLVTSYAHKSEMIKLQQWGLWAWQ